MYLVIHICYSKKDFINKGNNKRIGHIFKIRILPDLNNKDSPIKKHIRLTSRYFNEDHI